MNWVFSKQLLLLFTLLFSRHIFVHFYVLQELSFLFHDDSIYTVTLISVIWHASIIFYLKRAAEAFFYSSSWPTCFGLLVLTYSIWPAPTASLSVLFLSSFSPLPPAHTFARLFVNVSDLIR